MESLPIKLKVNKNKFASIRKEISLNTEEDKIDKIAKKLDYKTVLDAMTDKRK